MPLAHQPSTVPVTVDRTNASPTRAARSVSMSARSTCCGSATSPQGPHEVRRVLVLHALRDRLPDRRGHRPDPLPAAVTAMPKTQPSPIRSRISATFADLAQGLADADPAVRRVAVLALAETADPEAVPHLARAATDADPDVRRQAASPLGWLRRDRDRRRAGRRPRRSRPAGRGGRRREPDRAEGCVRRRPLLPLAGHADAFVRAAALRALRGLRLPERWAGGRRARRCGAGGAGAGRRRHRLPEARRDAALAHRGDPRHGFEVRRAAIGGLAFSRHASAVEAIAGAPARSRMERARVRREALGRAGNPEAAEVLIAALDDPAWQVRQKATCAASAGSRAPRGADGAGCALRRDGGLGKEAAGRARRDRRPGGAGGAGGDRHDHRPGRAQDRALGAGADGGVRLSLTPSRASPIQSSF